MKTAGMLALLVLLAGAVGAEEQVVEYKRSFLTLGAAFTIGDSLETDNLGYSASFMIHAAGGVQIADARLVVIGWRSDLVVPWLGFDANLSPVVGARIKGNLIQGSAYVGICPGVGLYVRCTPAIDAGVSYQPVIILFNFGGAEGVRNKISLSFKSFTEVKKPDWDQARPQRQTGKGLFMKDAFLAMALMVLSIVSASAQSTEWRLAGFIDGIPDGTIRVTIERTAVTTTVRSFVDGRAVSESILDRNGNPFSFRTFARDGAASLELIVSDGRRIAAQSGGRVWNLESRDAIVLPGPCTFWIFSMWLSRDPRFIEKSFSFYQDGQKKLVGMRLRNAGIETITVGGESLRAFRLDMTLADPLARMFWPHVYRYWFSAEDFRFLAYEGRMVDRRLSRTENTPGPPET